MSATLPDPVTELHTTASAPETWKFLDILAISITAIALVIAGLAGLTAYLNYMSAGASLTEQASLLQNSIVAGIEAVALIVTVAVLGVWRRKFKWATAGLRPVDARWLVRAVGAGVLFIPLLGLIAILVQLLLGLPLQNPQLEFLAPEDFSWGGAWAMLVLGGILVPFAEELYFRGVLYPWLRSHLRPWVAIVINAALFGVLHGEISLAVATFAMGMILAWFYERTASIWPSVLIHVINNSSKLVLLYAMIAAGVQISQ